MSNTRTVCLSVFVVLASLTAGCGGDGASDTTAASSDSTTTIASGESESDPTTSTTTSQGDGSTEIDGASSGETSVVLDLGGSTYLFGMGPNASCDPANLGVVYQAQLVRVDADGVPMGADSILVALDLEGRGTTVSAVLDGESWTAGEGTGGGSPSDTYSVDGPSAKATLAFVSSGGEEAEGRLEAFCAEG